MYAAWEGIKTAAISDANGAHSAFSMKVSKNGGVRVRGCLTDGKTLSASTRILISENGNEACIPVCGNQKAPVGFILWLGKDGNGNVIAKCVESKNGAVLVGDAVAGEAKVDSSKYILAVGDATADVDWDGKSFKTAKGSSVKLRYTKTTGMFSGSLKDAANKKISFSGAFVDGVGYGVTSKGNIGAAVKVAPKQTE